VIARYILLIVGFAFLTLALLRLRRERWCVDPAARTWLLIGVIFVLVSSYLGR
jgi:hypothetical protein